MISADFIKILLPNSRHYKNIIKIILIKGENAEKSKKYANIRVL